MAAFPKYVLACALTVGSVSGLLVASAAKPKPASTIRKVTALGGGSNVEVEIAASEPVMPHAQILTGPDRLIIDFPNSVPAAAVHNIVINRGEVKGVRVGLFGSNPSVTRVVVDLKAPQTYQMFPSGKTVIVKLNGGNGQRSSPGQAAVVANTPPPQPVKPASRLEVSFQKGKLSLWANGATLADVLQEVRRKTGADIMIPAGAEQEQVFAKYDPGQAREVLASLLNGSRFNFVMVASDRDPAQLRSVLLIPRGAPVPQPASYSPPPATVARVVPEPESPVEPDLVPDTPPAVDESPAQPQPPPQ